MFDEKRKATMIARAQDYERKFGLPLVDRMRELVQRYPNIVAPNWVSWEGHKYTNAATTKTLKHWIDVLTEEETPHV